MNTLALIQNYLSGQLLQEFTAELEKATAKPVTTFFDNEEYSINLDLENAISFHAKSEVNANYLPSGELDLTDVGCEINIISRCNFALLERLYSLYIFNKARAVSGVIIDYEPQLKEQPEKEQVANFFGLTLEQFEGLSATTQNSLIQPYPVALIYHGAGVEVDIQKDHDNLKADNCAVRIMLSFKVKRII